MSFEKHAFFPAEAFIAEVGLLEGILALAGLSLHCFAQKEVNLLPTFRFHRVGEK